MKKKLLVLALFILPALALIILAIHHRVVSPDAVVDGPTATRKMAETQSVWNKYELTKISTNQEFLARLNEVPVVEGNIALTAEQKGQLHQTLQNLVFANYSGDFDAYWKFIAPLGGYEPKPEDMDVESNIFATMLPNSPMPNSFKEMDRQIWSSQFAKHSYWEKIDIKNMPVVVLTTNQFPSYGLAQLYPDTPYGFGAIRGCYLSYENVIAKQLNKEGRLTVAIVRVMVETIDLPNSPRPFVYVFVEDQDDHVWLPLQMSYLSTKLFKFQPRF